MKISLRWLKEFVDVASDPRQLKSDLTMIGLNTESFAQVNDDWVLDVEVTTNRPDCLSHYGVARELATLYRQTLKKVEVVVKKSGKSAKGSVASADAAVARVSTDGVVSQASAAGVSIEIADPDLCARYCGRVIPEVVVGPSPDWLVKRLEAVGQRSINNVADITNYVLMELGHPLHAFDLSRLQQQKIIVRRARTGEPLRTLDGVERTLTPENLVIADAERPVALAGVMGGEESAISTSTRSVLLESAWFEPVSIRRTAKAQGLHTEASHRFERGADIEMAPLALDRAATLIHELAGGDVFPVMIDVFPRPRRRQNLVLRRTEILRILGAEVSWEEVERILRGLGFHPERRGVEGWRASPPSFRLDVSGEIDLIEEVARHFGYDRLPARVRPVPPRLEGDVTRDKILTVSSLLVALGYHEIITPAMVDPAESERFTDSLPVVLENPLSQDASAMRSSAVPSMLRAIGWNLDRDLADVKLFEIGKTYRMNLQGAPAERRVLMLGSTGHRRPASIYDDEVNLDFFDSKGDVETILSAFDMPNLNFEPSGAPYHQDWLGGRITSQGARVAVFGALRQDLGREYKLRQALWLVEFDLEHLLSFSLSSRRFQPFSKFPAVERDFSLVVPDAVPYARLSAAVTAMALEEIRGFRPVDHFRSSAIPAQHYSLLLRVTFQSKMHTLKSEEVAALGQQLLAALEPLGICLRG
jgi:phenylalanyl-tRNA synthetase beta chain